jgi:hypothetical protein
MSKEQCNKLIREKLPHLQELSFGCEFTQNWNIMKSIYWNSWFTSEEWDFVYTIEWDKLTYELKKDFEILWHPIQINDWLWLLPKDIVINSQWHLWKVTDEMWTDIHLVAKYDLSKPFDSQSDEFYEWLLAELI